MKLSARQANWRDYLAWHTLIDTYQQAGQPAEALGQARKLATFISVFAETGAMRCCSATTRTMQVH